MPGVYYFADGTTIGRPAMEVYPAGEDARPGQLRLLAPHPLQVLDAITGLNWHMICPADFFVAAAGVNPGSLTAGIIAVQNVTRTGPPDYRL